MHEDRNIAIIGALRSDFCLSFFNASLMKDPHGILEKQGTNTQHAHLLAAFAHHCAAFVRPG